MRVRPHIALRRIAHELALLVVIAMLGIAGAASAARASTDSESVQSFLHRLWPEARASGVRAEIFQQAFANFAPDVSIGGLNAKQPEFEKAIGTYIGERLAQKRVDDGRRKAAEHAALLSQIEARYGVDRRVILAVWGLETAYGAAKGNRSVIRSLATLALTDQRRSTFWRRELIAALVIAQERGLSCDQLVGSWAGAMGHTQFIPSTWLHYAVDFDRDGQRDLTNSVADALASTANYLSQAGWVSGLPWGFEVRLPTAFDYAWSTPGRTRVLSEWMAEGVAARVPGAVTGAISLGTPLQLLLPAGAGGPAFLVTANFKAILRYNQSHAYALGVALLADRLAGAPPVAAAWPTERPLSRGEKEELQRLLSGRGHRIADADGVIGPHTRLAIRATQRALRLPEDGHPTLTLLTRLRMPAEMPLRGLTAEASRKS